MKEMRALPKLKQGDKVAILSPSFAAPGKWPHMHELGLSRVRELFGLEPVEYPATRKIGASAEERSADLVAAFLDPEIKAVIATLGGDDQITYIKNLSPAPFANNPKPSFGFSDNTHFENFLWHQGVPSYYGGSLLTQFAMQKRMDPYTIEYIKHGLFDTGEFELKASATYNDIGLNWSDTASIDQERVYEKSEGWVWDGAQDAVGTTWGGCLESVDEILRHGGTLPTLEEFESVILFTETSEEIPTAEYVRRVYRALGERGILERVRGVLVGRPKAWDFAKQHTAEEKQAYREKQREVILNTVRQYNAGIPVIQNMEIGHTDPQIALPYGGQVRIDSTAQKIFARF